MVVYELTHIYYRYDDELVHSPKGLGLYASYESVLNAIQHFQKQPGFCENQDAFSIRRRNVIGNICDGVVYEVLLYLHTEDYEFEAEIDLGLFGDEDIANSELKRYCLDNTKLIGSKDYIVEQIVNRCVLGRKEWVEGFVIDES